MRSNHSIVEDKIPRSVFRGGVNTTYRGNYVRAMRITCVVGDLVELNDRVVICWGGKRVEDLAATQGAITQLRTRHVSMPTHIGGEGARVCVGAF
jgi:hypothetical protein